MSENSRYEYCLYDSQLNEFQLGNVVVTDPNNYLARSSIEFLSCFEVITSRFLKTHGGYLVIRDVDGANYLDYIEDFTDTGWRVATDNSHTQLYYNNSLKACDKDLIEKFGNKLTCTQKINFGKNLIDLTQEIDGADIKTGIIPLGARLEDSDGNQTDEYLTIESLPDGTLSEGIVKTGDHILNTTL